MVKEVTDCLLVFKNSARRGLLALGSRQTILGTREEESWTTLIQNIPPLGPTEKKMTKLHLGPLSTKGLFKYPSLQNMWSLASSYVGAYNSPLYPDYQNGKMATKYHDAMKCRGLDIPE
jgi:hypothetical protein